MTPEAFFAKANGMRYNSAYENAHANQAFRGWIDEIRLYDYPRSESQVRDSYQERKLMGQTR
ncbi:MAG: hypothetical protein A2498_01520 [Lentisphaerae bacterium RIFOXYC12_FULL_60_16]|nr:MAG: hypothetical protein A2498_01520 [Lentisphaerae bacterium RIFOXYC12_FULL_60_16]OGV74018.1 MAG: hypothetical protein A2269_08820 [Lentisphaerae bacterium RIFOXYA12_FULL_60_10]OGV75157.1 MAG: hypothetical protein A2340_05595 [Lentisphaerae bacterium RIFOXYB12_FULL_60_10]